MSTSNDKELLLMIAHNLINLYRLFGLDIAERANWVDVKSDSMHYKTPKKSRIYIDLPNATKILKSVEYKEVCKEFETECETLKRSIGDCMHNLLGKPIHVSDNSSKLQSIIDLTESDDEGKEEIENTSIGNCIDDLLGKRKSDSENVNPAKLQTRLMIESDQKVKMKKPKKKKRIIKKLTSELKPADSVVSFYAW